jgi:hypothetical protein
MAAMVHLRAIAGGAGFKEPDYMQQGGEVPGDGVLSPTSTWVGKE